MDNLNLKDVQNKLLKMFRWFDTICKENGLNYYMLGGTMLGAVRHKGFIPWDDDIDVGMPREDYDKFISLTQNLKDTYIVEDACEDNKEYRFLFAKIFDKSTTLVENKRKLIKRGLYIDVFPLDGLGINETQKNNHYKKVSKIVVIEDMITCAYRKERKWYKNFAVFIGRIISPLFIRERTNNYRFRKLASKYSFYDSNYVANFGGAWGIKEVMPKSYFGTPTLYEFEDLNVYGVENPDKYLANVYGDYMKLPPVEKRVTHHDYVEFNLNKSYLER